MRGMRAVAVQDFDQDGSAGLMAQVATLIEQVQDGGPGDFAPLPVLLRRRFPEALLLALLAVPAYVAPRRDSARRATASDPLIE